MLNAIVRLGEESVREYPLTRLEGGYSLSVDKLFDGEKVEFFENHLMNNKRLTCHCLIDGELSDGIIRLGHGDVRFSGSALEISCDKLKVFEYMMDTIPRAEFAHGLTIKDFLDVTIEVGCYEFSITVLTAGGYYRTDVTRGWTGFWTPVFLSTSGKALADITLKWLCNDFDKKIWLFGDSYFHTYDADRWPSYLVRAGYRDFLMSARPGRGSLEALEDFYRCLEFGTPKYAVWCLGMNDADDGRVNEDYKATIDILLGICKEKRIVPIIATIPNVPERDHCYKNDFVRSSGIRYVDFATAVGGEKKGSSWYEGMLSSDKVHPAPPGAKALFAKFISDFPEILI